jgi:hypothetical protein
MTLLMQSDIVGTVVWFLMFFIFIFIYPRLMLAQLIYKLEQSARKLESLSDNANKIVAKKVTKKPSKELLTQIREFSDFFVISPSSLDPFGIVKKIDQLIRNMEDRFTEFTGHIGKDLNQKAKQEVNYALRASIGLRQIAKIVRHNVEMAKKFKNLQIAMILQMQLPIIEKIAKGEFRGVKAFTEGWPIGDSIGPMVAASYMEKSKEIAKDVVMDQTTIAGRKVFVLKAKGPAPHLGRIDEAINKIMKRHKIARVITVDAAGKMEGEKTGSVAEGVGFAMGGFAQREIIENVLLPKKKPIDSIVIKVGLTEAIEPMKKKIMLAVPKVQKAIEKSVKRCKPKEKVLLIGIGNSCGIGNSKESLEAAKKIVEKLHKRMQKRKKKKSKKWL